MLAIAGAMLTLVKAGEAIGKEQKAERLESDSISPPLQTLVARIKQKRDRRQERVKSR